jgi:hypothetical protein
LLCLALNIRVGSYMHLPSHVRVFRAWVEKFIGLVALGCGSTKIFFMRNSLVYCSVTLMGSNTFSLLSSWILHYVCINVQHPKKDRATVPVRSKTIMLVLCGWRGASLFQILKIKIGVWYYAKLNGEYIFFLTVLLFAHSVGILQAISLIMRLRYFWTLQLKEKVTYLKLSQDIQVFSPQCPCGIFRLGQTVI